MPHSYDTPSISALRDSRSPASPPQEDWLHLPETQVWRGTSDDLPERCVVRRFEAQAARTPDALAVVCGPASLRYGTLNAQANRLARRLVHLGVGPDARVGICLERGPEMMVAVIAVLKAGGAYVPLDPGYPAERLAYMLKDSGVAVLLTQERLLAALRVPQGVQVGCVDGVHTGAAARDAENLEDRAAPENLAYVIYTSGSTGTPKGVMVSRGNLARSNAARDRFYQEPVGAYLLLSSIAFDSSVAGVFWTLCSGGALVLPAADELGDADRLRRLVDRAGVTHLLAVPSLYAQLAEGREPWGAGLRTVIVAGEACTPQLAVRHRARFPAVELVNEYGPTEATVWSTAHRCGAEAPGTAVPIGGPVGDTRAWVLDAALRPAGGGDEGELYLGGSQVTRGYLGRPALTAERFVPDAFGGEPGARLYRTGDRVRWRGEGVLDFLGRVDAQVKVRGFRVELGEVEAALRRVPGVRECAVVAREDALGETGLVAYVTGTVDAGALRAALRAGLPEHMVPGHVVPLDRLPLTPNGKLDRKALPAPRPAAAEEGHLAPRTPEEEALARIWCEVLGLESVGVDRPFLELGGHSLRAMRILARVLDQFGVRVAPQDLLRSGTIREIAALVRAGGGPAPADGAPALVRVSRDRPLPLSFSQEATWFFEQFAPGLMAYRAQSTIRIRGALDVPVLERALTEIVRRHEIFRTTFPVENGEPVQRIHAPWRVELPLHDVTGVDAAGREEAARALVLGEFLKPFDVTALPLVWWSLIRVDARDHVFVFVEHHFVHDGWSAGVFLRDLRALYVAYLEDRESPLPEPPVQFADFAVWQRRWMESDAAQAKLRYWEQALAGVPPLALPTDFPRPPVMRFRGARERVLLPAALAAEARSFSRAQGVTFFVTLLAAFEALMGRWSGQRDFAVGSGLGNRGHVALEDVIGMVVNTVAFRADLEGDPTGAELLRRVHETALLAYEHQDVPFDQVVRRIQPERSSSALPVYQVSFSFHDSHMADLRFGGLSLEMEEAQNNGSAKFDLQVTVVPRAEQGIAGLEDEVVMIWEYSTDLFAPETVRGIVRGYEALLAGLVREPARPIGSLALMEDDRRAVVEGWSRGDEAPAAAPLVHEAFAMQAARTPEAPAVVFEDQVLTYRALDARANRLAHHLAARGVGPEVRVGLCMERSLETVVSILAVLKAGGAWVPLDPAHPAERLARMAADAVVAVLVTRGPVAGTLDMPAGTFVVDLDVDAGEIADRGAETPPARALPENLAYVIFTSGSSGTPKGVAVQHRALANHMAWFNRAFGIGAGDRVLQKTPAGFDASVWEFFAPLMAGGCLVVARHDGERDPRYLARTVREREITVLQLVPTLLRVLLEEPEVAECRSLRRVFCGGEALSGDLCGRLAELLPRARLVNLYGPTECCIDSGTHACAAEDVRLRTAPIGRPVPGTRAYVLDAAGEPVPAGVPGELYVGGVQVARGYLGRPALTAERFVPDPFSAEPGARAYRTGDRARWVERSAEVRECVSAEGSAGVRECVSAEVNPSSAGSRTDALTHSRTAVLEYLGRLDEQVKVRGFRVELGEVDAALRRCPGVVDSVVVAREDGPGGTRLLAYVVGDVDADALRAELRRTLPEHMLPSAFTVMDALPVTPNGKLDRRALPVPEHRAAEGRVAPRTPVEEVLAEIWGEVLGVDAVGVNENFFALGGHSLLAMRVVSRIRQQLDGDVGVSALFESPTIEGLARSLSERDASAAGRGEAPAVTAASSPHRALAMLDELDDEEMDRLLALHAVDLA
jgi:amino acid adenylation domain-containing protein